MGLCRLKFITFTKPCPICTACHACKRINRISQNFISKFLYRPAFLSIYAYYYHFFRLVLACASKVRILRLIVFIEFEMQYVSKVACIESLIPSLPPGCDCARARTHTYPMFTDGTCSTRRSMCMPLPLRSARIPLAVAFRASVQTGASVYARELFACRPPSLPRVCVCRLSYRLSNLHCVPCVHVASRIIRVTCFESISQM